MKKILLIAVAAFVSVSVYAQGTVDFANIGGQIRLAPEMGGGPAPAGASIMAALYWAPDGVTDNAAFMQVGASANLLAPGTVVGGTRTAPVTPPGATANFQIRAWEVASGATFDEATHRGISDIVSVATGNPTVTPPGVPGSLGALSVQMAIVPEPSVIALGALGAGALLLLRRRK
jgi:hypothetical protein